MATATVNGVRLFYEATGSGPPLVLVHGSWGSHRNWAPVVPALARRHRVVAYDRRGHSDSERPETQGSAAEDAADLAALVEHLGLAPAFIAGNSFGATIALHLAAARPGLLQGVIAHEPPLFALLADDPAMAPLLAETRRRIAAVADRIAAGDHPGAAEQFIETVALGPGAWAGLPPEMRAVLVANAPTFLDETRDPDGLAIDLAALAAAAPPALLTTGGRSPPVFAPVVARLAAALPRARTHRFPDAGHIPHATHPEAWTEAALAFTSRPPAP
jgi:pimeloyl-ACP methyl ester carboxylesterase